MIGKQQKRGGGGMRKTGEGCVLEREQGVLFLVNNITAEQR